MEGEKKTNNQKYGSITMLCEGLHSKYVMFFHRPVFPLLLLGSKQSATFTNC